MKLGFAVACLAFPLSVGCVHSMPAPPANAVSAPGAADEIRANRDGTATVTGIVLENNHGCAVDAACYLRLQGKDKELRVIYHPGEGEYRIANKEMLNRASKVKQGSHVEVYGRYSKEGPLNVIEIYSSDKFYIHVLRE